MEIFVYSPQHFENLCVLSRTLEVLGINRCAVFDPNGLIRDRYGKSYSRKLRAVSAGAFGKIRWSRVEDAGVYLDSYPGRRIATVPKQDATSLYEFIFEESDMLVFGSEGFGLPDDIIRLCDVRLTIPQSGATESLNVSVASGMILGEWSRQKLSGATRIEDSSQLSEAF